MLLSGGMFVRKVQRVEIVPVFLNLRTFGNFETQVGEYRRHLLNNLAHRMNCTGSAGSSRERDVQALLLQALLKCQIRQFGFPCCNGGGYFVLGCVERRGNFPAFLWREFSKFAEALANFAGFLAECGQARRLKRGFGPRIGNSVEEPCFDFVQRFHPGQLLHRCLRDHQGNAGLNFPQFRPIGAGAALKRALCSVKRCLDLLNHGTECLGIIDRDLSQHLSIKIDFREVHSVDEP